MTSSLVLRARQLLPCSSSERSHDHRAVDACDESGRTCSQESHCRSHDERPIHPQLALVVPQSEASIVDLRLRLASRRCHSHHRTKEGSNGSSPGSSLDQASLGTRLAHERNHGTNHRSKHGTDLDGLARDVYAQLSEPVGHTRNIRIRLLHSSKIFKPKAAHPRLSTEI
ncbi:hypothetical protein PMAYCL1PPCAC_15683 [Pristionchus mayeri]|uniref:Uncharacterized protein n=1 Tax=Pristionchus mayeri TaxID=1317129 RepID=A0AAN5CJF2_9BILA|nr:hypothetical protein PMAYCL1PPCAC_15683 [Pristionchus mayeri]